MNAQTLNDNIYLLNNNAKTLNNNATTLNNATLDMPYGAGVRRMGFVMWGPHATYYTMMPPRVE